VFAEIVAPLTQTLELQFALRHDRYDRWWAAPPTPRWACAGRRPAVLVRASAGTGFRAPSLNDLYRPTKTGGTATLPDPVCMAENDNDLGICADIWETRTYANPSSSPSARASIRWAWCCSPRASA
jgi:iron complex outermembrane receptor protein